jgi:Ca-activated chloride channel family protein
VGLKRNIGIAVLSTLVLVRASTPAAQEPAGDPSSTIRVSTNLVMVPVSVTDRSGNVIRDLRAEDFHLEENGRRESVEKVVEPGETPLDLALLIDVSGSVAARFEFERQAAERFLTKAWRPGDRLSVFSIGPEPRLVQTKTSELSVALAQLRTLTGTRSSTAFFDAVVTAARFLRKSPAPDTRRVEVVLSDGEDNDSAEFRLSSALQEVQRSDCIFYSINPSGPSIHLNEVSLGGQAAMEALAHQTGGTAFVAEHAEELESMFDRIATELRAQYLLEYYSSDQRKDGAFRQIVVKVPARPDLRIRARQGYYPS